MKKGASNYERYIKWYFQLRLYVFIATLIYIIFNYNFTFNIQRTEEYIFDLIYYWVIVLCIFSGIYSYLLSKAITDNKYKKTVYYINTSLLILSLSIFTYGSFISSSDSLSTSVLLLMPFLTFNIVSWITTRRIQEIHFINNDNFLKKSSIGWLILLFVYFTIWAIQPYNRVFHERNWFELNLTSTSNWWEKLHNFNEKYSHNDLLFAYTNCNYNYFRSRPCFENMIFWDDLTIIKEKYNIWKSQEDKLDTLSSEQKDKKIKEMKNIYFKSLENWNYDKLIKIENQVKNIIESGLHLKSLNASYINNSKQNHSINNIQSIYKLLIEYNIDIKNYSQANIFINKYYDFLIEYSKSEQFGAYFFYRISNYYSLLKENNYTDIIYPKDIKRDFEYYKSYYLDIFTNDIQSHIYYSLPDIFLIFNKEELSWYYNYIYRDIKNNNYTFSYKPPILYNIFNNYIYNFWNNSEYYNKRYQEWIEFFEELIEKSEK